MHLNWLVARAHLCRCDASQLVGARAVGNNARPRCTHTFFCATGHLNWLFF